MVFTRVFFLIATVAAALGSPAAQAQNATAIQSDEAVASKPAAGGPAPLIVLFQTGSAILRPQDAAILDRASRAYNEGRPIVMILSGSSDRVGSAQSNLILSQKRATAVLKGLLDRGIPADRFQVLAKGETELPVPTKQGVPESQDRRVEITWH